MEGKCGVSVGLQSPPSPTWGSNPFGLMSIYMDNNAWNYDENMDWIYPILGLTWDRPTVAGGVGYINTYPPFNSLGGSGGVWDNIFSSPNNGVEPFYHGINLNDPKFLYAAELYNEPGNFGPLHSGSMQTYYEMTAYSRQAIQSYFPSEKIALNFTSPTQFVTYNSCSTETFNGTQITPINSYDIMTIHPYTQTSWNGMITGPEASVSSNTFYDAWGNPLTQTYYGGSSCSTSWSGIVPLLADLASYRCANTSNKPMWTTEYGWGTGVGKSILAITELTQAQYIVRGAILQLAGGVSKLMPFLFRDIASYYNDCEGMGLMRVDTTVKPALQAYSILAQLVNNLPYAGWVNKGTGSNIGCFVFGNSTQTVIAAWNPTQPAFNTSSISLPSGYTMYDMFGGPANSSSHIVYYVYTNTSVTSVTSGIGSSYTQGFAPASIFNTTY